MNTILGSIYPFTTITSSAFVFVRISTSFRLRTFLTFSNLSRGHTTVSYSMCIHSHHKIYSRLGAPSVTFSNVFYQIEITFALCRDFQLLASFWSSLLSIIWKLSKTSSLTDEIILLEEGFCFKKRFISSRESTDPLP